MDETFVSELTALIKKYKLEDLYHIPDYLLADWLEIQMQNLGTFLDNLNEFNDNVNEVLEAAINDDEPDDSITLDGDAASALASAGWGTDEDYGGTDERL